MTFFMRVPVRKKDFTQEQRRNLAAQGKAMPDGSFPIEDESDLKDAIDLVGMGNHPAAAKRFIIRRARDMGKESMLPDGWK